MQEDINPHLSVCGIVPTFYDGRTRVGRDILSRLASDSRYGGYVFDTSIRVNTAIAESSDKSRPVVFHRKSAAGAKDYTALAEEFLKRGGTEKQKKA